MLFNRIEEAVGSIERLLDICNLRHKTIASNIANIETPGYKAKYVKFEEELATILKISDKEGFLKRTNAKHFPIDVGSNSIQGVKVGSSDGGRIRNDQNNVDLDKEMAKMATNNLLYRAGALIITRRFQGIREAIQE